MKASKIIGAIITIAGVCYGIYYKKAHDPSKDWPSGTVVYELNTRQFTPEGTLKAAEAKLQGIRNLGADIVWLMPIYPIGEKNRKGSLGSYYAIKDYKAVNPEFGTLEDFDDFVKKAHTVGLKVIIDWVANHTSPDNAWVTEKPAEWYYRDSLGNTLVEYDWTDIAKLNYDCPDVREAMKDAMKFWIDRGIDGFRCDVAYQVPQDFWTDALAYLRQESGRPLYFLAEGEESWLHDAGFNATYTWKLHHLLNDIAQGKAGKVQLDSCLTEYAQDYPADAFRLTFTSNHDENSWSGSEFERMGDAWKAMTVLCYTLPQAQPLIYTGQEVGLDHRFQFFEKDPIPAEYWNDPERAKFAAFYKEMTALYHNNPVLWAGMEGGFEEIADTTSNMFTFKRFDDYDTVTVSVRLAEPWDYVIKSTAE